MPNDWFQFKQFRIEQDLCAMKVSTDACIQGAWAAKWLASNCRKPESKILDIGTGTGLLSLMMAQLNQNCIIDAVELNQEACNQAQKNFEVSSLHRNLSVKHSSLSDFINVTEPGTYDFIICNPPFFHNQLQSQEKARNDARHSISLSKEELARSAALLLNDQGFFCVLYPQAEWNEWIKISLDAGLYPVFSLEIKPKTAAHVNRVVGLFSKKNNEPSGKETLVIYEEDKSYTEAFKALLQPYYLAL